MQLLDTTVRRKTGWWTPAVHSLLQYLETVGWGFAPRVVGNDPDGYENLQYIAGESGADGWRQVVSEPGLARFAQLIRSYHDAVRRFTPAGDAAWAFGFGLPERDGLICHGDCGPRNVVWRQGMPVGLLDWDLAGPGDAMDDVCYALEYVAPFRSDEECTRWWAYSEPPNRAHRIEVFARAYGLPDTRELVTRVIERQRLDIERVTLLATKGVEPQASWVTQGYLDELKGRVEWSIQHRHLCE